MTAAADAPAYRLTVSVPRGAVREALGPGFGGRHRRSGGREVDRPLWRIPGVLVTPHAAGATPDATPRMARLVRAQVDRMLAGEPPLNVVVRS